MSTIVEEKIVCFEKFVLVKDIRMLLLTLGRVEVDEGLARQPQFTRTSTIKYLVKEPEKFTSLSNHQNPNRKDKH